MFFNYPTMFETPMFYQPRPSYYQRRPRNVYRRQQPERSFSFSPFMSELDGLYGYPDRQQTNENECNCGNCRSNFQRKAEKSEPENQTLNVENSQNEKIPESEDLQQVSENIDSNREDTSKTESSDSEAEEKVESVQKVSNNFDAIIEIAKQSETMDKDLRNTDWDCLDDKQTTKRLRYFAENQYKLIEKLDMIHTENIEERNLRKTTVKSIQKRLNSVDSKLD